MKLILASRYRFIEEPRYYFFGWSESPSIAGRDSLLKALVRARSFLPPKYNFKIWDLFRTRSVQEKMIASFKKRLNAAHPNWQNSRIQKEVWKFAAKPDAIVTRSDTHRNGGAVDLTIVDSKGNELYMGTDHDDLTEKAAPYYFEKKKNISALDKIAKKNRRLLRKAMLRAGFIEHKTEWWHWGYSD